MRLNALASTRRIEWIAAQPGLEGGRGQDLVERQRKLVPILGRKEFLQFKYAECLEGRRLYLLNECFKR